MSARAYLGHLSTISASLELLASVRGFVAAAELLGATIPIGVAFGRVSRPRFSGEVPRSTWGTTAPTSQDS